MYEILTLTILEWRESQDDKESFGSLEKYRKRGLSAQVSEIFKEIQSRVGFKYEIKDLLLSTVFCCLRSRVEKNKTNDKYRNHYLFYKGVKKLNHEFDAINLLKVMN